MWFQITNPEYSESDVDTQQFYRKTKIKKCHWLCLPSFIICLRSKIVKKRQKFNVVLPKHLQNKSWCATNSQNNNSKGQSQQKSQKLAIILRPKIVKKSQKCFLNTLRQNISNQKLTRIKFTEKQRKNISVSAKKSKVGKLFSTKN